MKACLLLQRRFAHIGHKLAVILKEKSGINEFCGYVYLRSSYDFLKSQTDIKYTSLILDEDIHNEFKKEPLDLVFLKNFEKEYGLPNLWPYLWVDRVIMFGLLAREYPYNTPKYTHEEMMRILQVKAKAINKFLDDEKPDFIFMIVVGGLGTMLLYQIAKKKNIKVIVITETRLGDGIILNDNYQNFNWAEEKFNDLQKRNQRSVKAKAAKDYLEKFRQHPTTYSYDPSLKIIGERRQQLKKLLPKNLIKSLYWYAKYVWRYLDKKGYNDYCEENPLTYLLDRLKRKTRAIIGFNFLYDLANLNEDFAYFPLHVEPEMSTLLFAPFWTDQINLIKQIAKSLPLHFKLYIKEHPMMLSYRTHAFYRELKKIPNVKLINHSFNSFELIRKAKLIVTITGSTGWEAVMLKKPVITFGNVFYNVLSMVKKCVQIEQLPYLIKEQLENHRCDEQELENFIGAILEESASIGLIEIWEKGIDDKKEEKKRLEMLADLIAKKLILKPPAMVAEK